MNCPQCGLALVSQAGHYEAEVRKLDSDPVQLARIAPPTRRASIHGFILAVLAWILMLIPFFASDRARFRNTAATALMVAVWIVIFRRARQADAVRLAEYQKRGLCPSCGWVEG